MTKRKEKEKKKKKEKVMTIERKSGKNHNEIMTSFLNSSVLRNISLYRNVSVSVTRR